MHRGDALTQYFFSSLERKLNTENITVCRDDISWSDDNFSSAVSYLVVAEYYIGHTQYLCLPCSVVLQSNNNYHLSAYQRVKGTVL